MRRQFFGGCTGPNFGPIDTIKKNDQKNTRRPIFTKTTQNALQCNVLATGPQWLKHDPKLLTMPRDNIPEVRGAPGGQGGARGENMYN